MKDGWKEGKLCDLCTIERGGSPRPIKSFITTAENGLNWIKIGDTEKDGKYIYKTAEKIKPEGLKKSRWVEKDEFLLSNSMSFGRPYILKTNGCIHDGWLVLRDYQANLTIDFFYYLLTSPRVQNQFKAKAQGSTVSNLNTDRVASVVVSYPSLSVQQSIVEYLDSSFAKIDAMKANAKKALDEAKALFQASLKSLLEPKDGWTEKVMKDVCETITDFVAAGSFASLRENVVYNDSEDYAQLVRTTDLKSNFSKGHFVYVNKHAFDYLYRVNLDKDCIILPNVGVNCGEVYFVTPSQLPYANNVLGPNAVMVRSNRHDNCFLSYLFQGKDFQEQLSGITSHMAQPKFNKTGLKTLTLRLPSLTEQQSIVTVLDNVRAKVDQLQANYDKISAECDALKQALLKQVFE